MAEIIRYMFSNYCLFGMLTATVCFFLSKKLEVDDISAADVLLWVTFWPFTALALICVTVYCVILSILGRLNDIKL